MPIVASAIIENVGMPDGRKAVMERFTDHLGKIYERRYICAAGVDPSVGLASRAADLLASLGEGEVNAALIATANPASLEYATLAQLRAALRTVYREATKYEAIRLGKKLAALTDGQLATIFGYSNPSAQLTALRAKLTAQASKYDDVDDEGGE